MDNHLGNNERFSILPGHKSSRHSPHPNLIVKFPVGHISWWPVTKKNNERRVLVQCVIPSPPPPPPSSLSGSSAHGAVGVLALRLGLVWHNPHHIASRADRRRRCQDYFPSFPLVNSSFGNNENSAIARKCAWAVRSRYNRVSLYIHLCIYCV